MRQPIRRQETLCPQGVTIQFDLPQIPPGGLKLTITHGTKRAGGSGYAPIDISMNGTSIFSGDAATKHGGSAGAWYVDNFNIAASGLRVGTNTVGMTAAQEGDYCVASL